MRNPVERGLRLARRLRKAHMHQVFEGMSPSCKWSLPRPLSCDRAAELEGVTIDHAGGSAMPRASGAEAQAKVECWLAARDLIDAFRGGVRCRPPRRSKKRAGSLGGGLGVRLPAHATHEERPLFAVQTPIVNPERLGARCVVCESGARSQPCRPILPNVMGRSRRPI